MFLPEFTSTDIQREPARVFDTAQKEPVVINRMGHKAIVAMSKSEFSRLKRIEQSAAKKAG